MALAQVSLWIVGTVIMTAGVGLIHSGRDIGEPLAAISSLLVLSDMLLFGWLVVRRERYGRVVRPSLAPAE